MNVEFKIEKETKGTVRYKEQADEPVIGTLYVKKGALPVPYPAKLTMTLSW
jgi:hypothetical protein